MNFSRVMGLLARTFGDREALVNVERNRRYTYRELHACTNRIANMLRDTLKLRTGDKLMLILDNDNMSLMHFMATWKQEATAVYTNFRDSLEEHSWQVELVRPRVVFVESACVARYHAMLRRHGCTIVAMDPLPEPLDGVLDFWTLVDAASPEENDCELDVHEHTPLLRFTGGTTGKGKCAMYSIDACLGTRDGMLMHPDLCLDQRMRFLHFAPLSHGSALFYYVTPFVGGATVTQNQPDLLQWRRVVEQEKITHSFLVPTLLYRLLDLQSKEPADLRSLTTLIYGAAPISPARLGDLVKAFGPVFAQGYAATEAVMLLSLLGKADHAGDDSLSRKRLASAGRVSPGIEIYAADESGASLPPGQTGELMIRCRSLIKGYFQNPEGTAAEIVNGTWKSGDLGYIDEDGYVFIVDRKKDMIISGGFNIYPSDLEGVLREHAAVAESAVVGVPSEQWGETPVAYVVRKAGDATDAAQLLQWFNARVGKTQRLADLHFIEELPRSAIGKVLKRELRDRHLAGAAPIST